MSGLPSWVQNWSKDIQGHLQLQPLRKSAYWNASGPKRAQCSFADEDKIFIMEERNIGCIRTTKTSAHKDASGDLVVPVDTFFDWLDMISNIGGDMIENTLDFADILTMGRYRSRRGKLGAVIG
jgi:hypothetical protein